jgi:hypothetical protein
VSPFNAASILKSSVLAVVMSAVDLLLLFCCPFEVCVYSEDWGWGWCPLLTPRSMVWHISFSELAASLTPVGIVSVLVNAWYLPVALILAVVWVAYRIVWFRTVCLVWVVFFSVLLVSVVRDGDCHPAAYVCCLVLLLQWLPLAFWRQRPGRLGTSPGLGREES